MELCNITGLKGKVTIPGDKSISHRCIMFGSIANGTTQIHNFLSGADCLATIRCFRELGIEIEVESDYSSVIVHGKGLHGLSAPEKILDVGNSGTTTRLISGILAGQPFDSKLSGDESLNSRPMKRIIEPLTQMGAHISSILRNGCAPLYITPAQLHGIHYNSPVASAQVKSCLLLAGLYADGETSVTEPSLSRNHTELMLKEFGADIRSTFEIGSSKATAIIRPCEELYGQEITVPGDKSISHRAVMFGSLAEGTTRISNFLEGADCLSTISCFRKMGINIENTKGEILVHGKGLHGLSTPAETLDVGNSGTTTRLISGILAGQDFVSELTGDASIQKRPMKRIMTPLSQMGADIVSLNGNGCAPLKISGKKLHAIHYNSPVASAQVKSCVLLAGMYSDGITRVTEPVLSRNHTEIMLNYFGANVTAEGTTASIKPDPSLYGREILVPGDISSAAYFIAAGLLVPNSEILLKNVGINPTRDGILRVCRAMGADITLLNETTEGEPTADLLIRSSALHGTTIEGAIIPTLIDELPMIAVMAAFAEGTTVIRDAQELRVKESDRIQVMTENLRKMGADIQETEDGMIIHGGKALHGAEIDSHLDHRVAMSFAVAGLLCEGTLSIKNGECVNISYPEFYSDLYSLAE